MTCNYILHFNPGGSVIMKKYLVTFTLIILFFISFNLLLSLGNTFTFSAENSNINMEPAKKHYEKSTSSGEAYEDFFPFTPAVSQIASSLTSAPISNAVDEELTLKLINYLGENRTNVGLVYYNLSTKAYVRINENMDFDAASTYKVGLNLLYYYLAEKGVLSLTDTIAYYDYYYQDGTGILAGYCYSGMKISIQDLLDLSIIYSDNIATAMLSEYLGGYNAVRQQLYTVLNIDYILYANMLTPAISVEILNYIYENMDLPGFHHLIETMKVTIFHERLDRYLPYNLVAHKIGSIDSYVHDIGFVFTEEPYIISIFTVNLYNADKIIADLSKIIYNKHTGNLEEFEINKILYNKS